MNSPFSRMGHVGLQRVDIRGKASGHTIVTFDSLAEKLPRTVEDAEPARSLGVCVAMIDPVAGNAPDSRVPPRRWSNEICPVFKSVNSTAHTVTSTLENPQTEWSHHSAHKLVSP